MKNEKQKTKTITLSEHFNIKVKKIVKGKNDILNKNYTKPLNVLARYTTEKTKVRVTRTLLKTVGEHHVFWKGKQFLFDQ
jgi:ribosomal protein S18